MNESTAGLLQRLLILNVMSYGAYFNRKDFKKPAIDDHESYFRNMS